MGHFPKFGLAIALAAAPAAWAQVTYMRDIAPILAAKCIQCHRAGDIAPFSLDAYEKAFDYKDDIRRVITDGIMPPWKPVAGHGEFVGNFSLTPEEKIRIQTWVDTGAEKGDEADFKPLPVPEGEWSLGEPDLQLKMPESYTPPRGRDMYRCFVLPTGFTESRFVSAVDVLPGDRRYVHHVILYLDNSGTAERLDEAEDGPGYTCFGGAGTPVPDSVAALQEGYILAGWAPGTRPRHLPEGIGVHVAAGARVVMQIHYYARGGTGPDETRVGLYFNRERPKKRLYYVPVADTNLRIPPGAAEHREGTDFVVPPFFDATVVNVFPHMHLLGKEIRATVVQGRDEKPLIYINDWDFNWQGPYTLATPAPIPAFSRVRLACTYNNTESNPRNPSNPLKTVTWGEGTEDEMCLVFLGVTFDNENL